MHAAPRVRTSRRSPQRFAAGLSPISDTIARSKRASKKRRTPRGVRLSLFDYRRGLVPTTAAATTATVATAAAAAATTTTAAAAAVRRALLEAVAAVHRAIATRLEGNFCFFAAARALRRVHLARAGRVAAAPATTAVAATSAAARVTAARLARAPAVRAPLRLVGEAAARVELLIFCGEREFRSAVHARQLLVSECHLTTSDERFLVVRTERSAGVAADSGTGNYC
jgi:hypothetical protein